MKFKKILVPVDGSEFSRKAAGYAAELANAMGSEIVLVHCHKSFPSILGEPYYQQAVSNILKESNELLEPYRELFNDMGATVIERILEGPPRETIPQVAGIEGCDLIVIGTRGRSDLEGLFLGSVTHRVLRVAPCPVMVIR